MTLLPTELRSRRSRIAEQFRRAARPVGHRAAVAAQVGRARPFSATAALALVGLAAALAASPKARAAVRQSLARLSGTRRRA